jgi:FKBP-type peptidyl-prolyl cis-trans isomerase 2
VKIEKGRRVRLQAMLKVKNGDIIEKSAVEYIQGGGTMLPGLEKVLEGLESGSERKGVLPARDAFGAMQPQKDIPRKEFAKDLKLEKGQRLEAKGPGGQPIILEIQRVTDEMVETRLVHPLADKDIEYEVKVINVTDPSPPPMPAELLEEEK